MEIHIRPRYVRCQCGGRYLKISKDRYVCQECDNEYPSNFYLEFWWAGKQRLIYSDERGRSIDSKVRAKLLKEDILFEIQNGSFSIKKYVKVKAIKASVLLEEFYKEKTKTIAPSYLSNYTTQLKTAKSFFGGRNVREINKKDFYDYQKHLEDTKKEAGPSTIKSYLQWFRTFLNWCKERELITMVPTLPKIECPTPIIPWVNRDDQLKILNAFREPDKEIVKFSILHGTRPGETRALKTKDVDLDKRIIRVYATFSGNIYREKRKGVGAKGIVIPIHPVFCPSWKWSVPPYNKT
jgi:integrase